MLWKGDRDFDEAAKSSEFAKIIKEGNQSV